MESELEVGFARQAAQLKEENLSNKKQKSERSNTQIHLKTMAESLTVQKEAERATCRNTAGNHIRKAKIAEKG